jgi:ABC-type Fe3+ transport system substrate-binding protein
MSRAVSILALLVALAAPARAADQALIDAAKKEGKVVWYTTLILQQLGTPIAEAFEKKYGIKVEATRNDPGETALRLVNEHRAGNMQADVFDGSFAPTAMIQEGVLAKYQPDLVKDWPAELKDKNGYWTAHRLTVITPGYNTNLVKPADVPKTWNDFLDPKWKGKMAWGINPGITAATGFSGLVLRERGEEKGMAFLRELAKQNITGLKISARAVLDQVIAGEYPLALQILNDNAVISRNKGAPVAWIPMNPAFASVSLISVTAKARNPNAGRLLAEFVVSEEGQDIARQHDYIPVHPKVPAPEPDMKPDGQKFRAITFSPEEVDENMPKWKKVYEELFR